MLSIASANVNGIRAARRRGGIEWLAAADVDLLTLQEVRGDPAQLAESLAGSPFEYWHVSYAPSDQAGRSGVAILSRSRPSAVRIGLGSFRSDGRWIEADFHGGRFGQQLTAVSAYVHTGEADTARQRVKFRFLSAMRTRMRELEHEAAQGQGEALITGDLNVAHQDLDLKNWRGNRSKAGFLPREREYFDRWLGYGFDADKKAPRPRRRPGNWVDIGRKHAPDGPGPYTWWSWRGQAFDNDAGWRIDYHLATTGLARRSRSSVVGRAPSYAQRWSDHAAVVSTFD
ncbi:MAG: exodeoxyribonuclease III [Beutenbergiaceae bacterium]